MNTNENESAGSEAPDAAVATAPAPAPAPSAKSKPKAKAPAKAKPVVEGGILTLSQGTSRALKEGVSVDIGRIFVIPLATIHSYNNPRHEPEHLYDQGYTLIGDPKVEEASEDKYVSLIHLALSD